MSTTKLKVALLGCGRQGKVHAQNFYNNSRCEIVAASDPSPEAKEWISQNLPGIKYFSDPDLLYAHFQCKKGAKVQSGGVDAVVISTETDSHERLCIQAIEMGIHVLLEKPIALDLEAHWRVIEAGKKRPDVKVLIALSRRFDPSYNAAKQKILKGDLGEPYLIKSSTVDLYHEGFLAYSLKSGGIWIDCGIHDIDCARYLLGVSESDRALSSKPIPRPQRVFALGTNVRLDELSKFGDADSTTALIEFSDGKSCMINLGRAAVHAHDTQCEVTGKKGKLSIGSNPNMDRLVLMDATGVRNETCQTYSDRFKEAFVVECDDFISNCLDNKPLRVSLYDALEGARIATALTYSLRSGLPCYFDENGDPIKPEGGRSIESDSRTAIKGVNYLSKL